MNPRHRDYDSPALTKLSYSGPLVILLYQEYFDCQQIKKKIAEKTLCSAENAEYLQITRRDSDDDFSA